MDLLTITCSHDKLQMLLQAESIQKFLSPCTHWVVVDDTAISVDEWYSFLSPYYSNHTLKVVNGADIIPSVYNSKGGWSRQQYYKLDAFRYIKDDYLTLDSKNFFIKKTDINEWDLVVGNGTSANFTDDNNWRDTIVEYAKYFDVPVTFQHLSILTPFVFHKSVLETITDYQKFLEDFADQTVIESEFLLYSTLLHKLNRFPTQFEKKSKFYMLSKDFNMKADQLLPHFFDKEHVKVAGLHRSLIYNYDYENQLFVSSWLNKKGLSTNLFGENFHI